MKCDTPLHIINPYTYKPMTVSCRNCDSCKISNANSKSLLLRNELSKGYFPVFFTLTYDNKNLPVVFNGEKYIYRENDFGDLVAVYELKEFVLVDECLPYHYRHKYATGVLFYRDVQLFLKRLRINLKRNGKGNFRFFAACEYGTVRKRPHYHILCFFRKLSDLNGFAEIAYKSWGMCDKNRFLVGVKFADCAISSYLASYVNCLSSSYSLAEHKVFGQKTRRSACLNYGCTKKDEEVMYEVIRNGVYKSKFEDYNRPFEYFDTTRKDRFSVGFVSERVFRTYFRRPYKYSSISAKCFSVRARIIYKLYFGTLQGELHPLDLNFIRGYRAYLVLMGFQNTYNVFLDYVDLFLRMESLYYSQLNRRYMLSYEKKSKNDYFLDAYNTECRSVGSSDFYNKLLVDFEVKYIDEMSLITRHELDDYKFQYRKKLIPKHQNSMYYDFV